MSLRISIYGSTEICASPSSFSRRFIAGTSSAAESGAGGFLRAGRLPPGEYSGDPRKSYIGQDHRNDSKLKRGLLLWASGLIEWSRSEP